MPSFLACVPLNKTIIAVLTVLTLSVISFLAPRYFVLDQTQHFWIQPPLSYLLCAGVPVLATCMLCAINTQIYLFDEANISEDDSEDEADYQLYRFDGLPRPYWESIQQHHEEIRRKKAERADAKEEQRIRQMFIDEFGPKRNSLLGVRREEIVEVLEMWGEDGRREISMWRG